MATSHRFIVRLPPPGSETPAPPPSFHVCYFCRTIVRRDRDSADASPRANSWSCAACKRHGHRAVSVGLLAEARTPRSAAGTATARWISRTAGSNSRSPFDPMPPPRITSSGSTHGGDGRDRQRDPPRLERDHAQRRPVPLARLFEHPLRPSAEAPSRARARRRPRCARRRVQRAPPAARRVVGIRPREREVADLAGSSRSPSVELAVQHHPMPTPVPRCR